MCLKIHSDDKPWLCDRKCFQGRSYTGIQGPETKQVSEWAEIFRNPFRKNLPAIVVQNA